MAKMTVSLILILLLTACTKETVQRQDDGCPVEVMFEDSQGYLFLQGHFIIELKKPYDRHFFMLGDELILCSDRNETSGDCNDQRWKVTLHSSPYHQVLITKDGQMRPFVFSEIYGC